MKNKSSFGKIVLYAILILAVASLVYCFLSGGLLSDDSSDSLEQSEHDAVYEKINAGFSEHKTTIIISSKCNIDRVGDIYSEVLLDHPEYFWEKGAHITQLRIPFISLSFIQVRYLCEPSALHTMTWRLDSAVDNIVRQADQYETDEEKAAFVHDYLVANCDYDDAGYNSGVPESLSYTCYGCLVDQLAVCQGYAEAYQLLMNRLGIECGLVTGTAVSQSVTSPHAWNYIRLGDEYYMVDVTWDDPLGYSGPIRHDYYCLTAERMGHDHFPDGDRQPWE